MKECWNNYKREISIGVIVSIITTMVIKCGDWLVKAVPAAGLSITNYIYYSAASISDAVLTEIVIVLIVGLLFSVAIIVLGKSHKATKKLKNVCNELEKQNANVPIAEEIVVNEDIDDNESEIRFFKSLLKKGNRLNIFFILVIILYFSFLIIGLVKPAELSQSFERDITMIHPYVDDADIIQLESDWVRMKTKSDYEEIYEFIDNVKVEYMLEK